MRPQDHSQRIPPGPFTWPLYILLMLFDSIMFWATAAGVTALIDLFAGGGFDHTKLTLFIASSVGAIGAWGMSLRRTENMIIHQRVGLTHLGIAVIMLILVFVG